jgi:hypothetical protein
MTYVECQKDNEGYWTVGEAYRTESEGEISGAIRIHDDDDSNCEWVLIPVEWDEDLQVMRYQAAGLDAEFIEVA